MRNNPATTRGVVQWRSKYKAIGIPTIAIRLTIITARFFTIELVTVRNSWALPSCEWRALLTRATCRRGLTETPTRIEGTPIIRPMSPNSEGPRYTAQTLIEAKATNRFSAWPEAAHERLWKRLGIRVLDLASDPRVCTKFDLTCLPKFFSPGRTESSFVSLVSCNGELSLRRSHWKGVLCVWSGECHPNRGPENCARIESSDDDARLN